MTDVAPQRICPHCGSVGERRLGRCNVCGDLVCSRCGNVQHVRGEEKVMHDRCLRESQSSDFSMIRFVK